MLRLMLAVLLSVPMPAFAGPSKADTLLQKMTLEEKLSLVHGMDDMSLPPIQRLGIPRWRMTDGPHGPRGDNSIVATAFPAPIALAASWDAELARLVGAAQGSESLAFGRNMLLAPGINIIRTPIGGRSFEYLSEDPYLISRLAPAFVRGVQDDAGAAVSVKHFAANSVEKDRMTVDARVDERTLREIYLPGFKAAVDAGAATVMAAYNKLNGVYCAENGWLLDLLLRKEWGFKGLVVSDWGAVHSTQGTALNGVDVEMPGGTPSDFFGKALTDAIKGGELAPSVVDAKVRRILGVMERFGALDGRVKAGAADTPEHQALARRAAEEGLVLLKNEVGILPLDARRLRRVAVIGPLADARTCRGGGSSEMNPPYEVTVAEGLKRRLAGRAEMVFLADKIQTRVGTPVPPSWLRNVRAYYFANKQLDGKPAVRRAEAAIGDDWGTASPAPGIPAKDWSARWTAKLSVPSTGDYQLGLRSDDGSRLFLDGKPLVDQWRDQAPTAALAPVRLEAGKEYDLRVEYYQGGGEALLSLIQDRPATGAPAYVAEAAEAARQADAAILVVGTTKDYDHEGGDKPDLGLMPGQDLLVEEVLKAKPDAIVVLVNGSAVEMPWLGRARAVLEAWYPGMEGGTAVASALLGDINPGGKLPITFPKKLADVPAHANGDVPEAAAQLKYDEGVFVGYRHYDSRGVEPLFPFGHGLSYTRFEYGDVRAKRKGDGYEVSFDVRNAGEREGTETAQLYLRELKPSVPRPFQELKGFQKVRLKPGKSERVTLLLPAEAFSFWDVSKRAWRSDPGEFEARIGASSRDIRLTTLLRR